MHDKHIYSVILVVLLIAIILFGDWNITAPIALAGVFIFIINALREQDRQDQDREDCQDPMLEEEHEETSLLQPYEEDFKDSSESKQPKKPKQQPEQPKQQAKCTLEDDLLIQKFNERTDDGDLNFISHATNKFKLNAPKKMSVDVIKKWIEDEPINEERRMWWGNYED